MATIHLLGATTPTGHAFSELVKKSAVNLECYSRYPEKLIKSHQLDLNEDIIQPDIFHELNPGSSLVCFAPIVIFSKFLQCLYDQHPDLIKNFKCIIACSSTSISTKSFAYNSFDRSLSRRLKKSEFTVSSICDDLDVPLLTLRPSMIYGRVGEYIDQNIMLLISLLRRLPIIFLPRQSGLRQPIHSTQLANIVFTYLNEFPGAKIYNKPSKCISVGGDSEITYIDLLKRIQVSLPEGDPARTCLLFTIPNRLFFFLLSPLVLISPKLYESILRISCDLSGFTPSYILTDSEPCPFPIDPFS